MPIGPGGQDSQPRKSLLIHFRALKDEPQINQNTEIWFLFLCLQRKLSIGNFVLQRRDDGGVPTCPPLLQSDLHALREPLCLLSPHHLEGNNPQGQWCVLPGCCSTRPWPARLGSTSGFNLLWGHFFMYGPSLPGSFLWTDCYFFKSDSVIFQVDLSQEVRLLGTWETQGAPCDEDRATPNLCVVPVCTPLGQGQRGN